VRTRLRRVGGEVMVVLPSRLLKHLQLRAGSAVDITVEGGKLVLGPTRYGRAALVRTRRKRPARTGLTASQTGPWAKENREAMDSSNAYVARHGLPLARYRRF